MLPPQHTIAKNSALTTADFQQPVAHTEGSQFPHRKGVFVWSVQVCVDLDPKVPVWVHHLYLFSLDDTQSRGLPAATVWVSTIYFLGFVDKSFKLSTT